MECPRIRRGLLHDAGLDGVCLSGGVGERNLDEDIDGAKSALKLECGFKRKVGLCIQLLRH